MTTETVVETAVLAANLDKLGIRYLRTETAVAPKMFDPPTLIKLLVQHPQPRLREALILLFLRHPSYARYVPDLSNRLPATSAQTLRHLYTASVYLQRLWQGKLELYLGKLPLLPNYFGQSEWELPAPTFHYGEAGLRILAQRLRSETGDNWLNTYQTTISLFLTQLALESRD